MTATSLNNNVEFATPGQILRAHREKLGLSSQDIAQRIRLDIKLVEGIEKDHNKGMPAATYVRGYLRSYAKIVGADADHLISLYDTDSSSSLPKILPDVKPPTQASSDDKPVKIFTYLLTLGLVLLSLIWYQGRFVVDRSEPENYNTTNMINGVDITYAVIHHPDSWQFPVSAPEKKTGLDPVIPTLHSENDLSELQPNNDAQTPDIITAEDFDKKQSISIGSGPDVIELELTRDSWVAIQDAENKKIFHDLALGGEQYSIRGTAPFNILFGFSSGITMKFNGKVFDHLRYANKNVARFKLPE